MKQSNTFLTIGLTGGAGSGKTTVVEYLKTVTKVEFLHCDIIAHELMEPGQPSFEALVQEFGQSILVDGKIDRARLSLAAFATPESAKRINEITHPLVTKRLLMLLEELRKNTFSGIVVIEAALLLEAGIDRLCDEVWYVHAPVTDRKKRMKENRGYSQEKIEKILAAQLPETVFFERADFVVENPDGMPEKQKEVMERQILPYLKERFESQK